MMNETDGGVQSSLTLGAQKSLLRGARRRGDAPAAGGTAPAGPGPGRQPRAPGRRRAGGAGSHPVAPEGVGARAAGSGASEARARGCAGGRRPGGRAATVRAVPVRHGPRREGRREPPAAASVGRRPRRPAAAAERHLRAEGARQVWRCGRQAGAWRSEQRRGQGGVRMAASLAAAAAIRPAAARGFPCPQAGAPVFRGAQRGAGAAPGARRADPRDGRAEGVHARAVRGEAARAGRARAAAAPGTGGVRTVSLRQESEHACADTECVNGRSAARLGCGTWTRERSSRRPRPTLRTRRRR